MDDTELVKCNVCGFIHHVIDGQAVGALTLDQRIARSVCMRCGSDQFVASCWAELPLLANTLPLVRTTRQ